MSYFQKFTAVESSLLKSRKMDKIIKSKKQKKTKLRHL